MPDVQLKCLRCGGPAVRLVQTGELSCAQQCAEGAVHMAKRIVLEEEVGNIARALGQVVPDGIGFTLVLFNFGKGGSMSYASSGRREETMAMLRELLDKMTSESNGEGSNG